MYLLNGFGGWEDHLAARGTQKVNNIKCSTSDLFFIKTNVAEAMNKRKLALWREAGALDLSPTNGPAVLRSALDLHLGHYLRQNLHCSTLKVMSG